MTSDCTSSLHSHDGEYEFDELSLPSFVEAESFDGYVHEVTLIKDTCVNDFYPAQHHLKLMKRK